MTDANTGFGRNLGNKDVIQVHCKLQGSTAEMPVMLFVKTLYAFVQSPVPAA